MTAVQAALEMQHHSARARAAPPLRKGVQPPESLLLHCFNPEASLPGKATLLKEDAGEASRDCF